VLALAPVCVVLRLEARLCPRSQECGYFVST